MAGERYAAELKEFNKKYTLNYSISEHYDFKKKMKTLSNFAMNADYANADLNLYVETLTNALSAKLESISKIESGRLYRPVDFSIGDFIESFDKLMQAKFADEAKENKTPNTHKPLEGATYAAVANAVWKQVKHFDKPTPDVWAESMLQGKLTLEDIKSVLEPAKERMLSGNNEDVNYSELSDYLNVYMAKQALDKVIEKRSFWWKAWPGNWRQWYRESQYAEQLGNDLLSYSLLSNLPDEENLKELTERSMIGGAKDKLNTFLKEKKAAEKNVSEEIEKAEEIEEEQYLIEENEEEMDLDQMQATFEKNLLNIDDKIDAQDQITFKKPENLGDMKKLFQNKDLEKEMHIRFTDVLSLSTNVSIKSCAEKTFFSLRVLIGDTWTDQKNMQAHAINFFKTAYNGIKNETPGMNVAEKLVAAQKMTDIMLNIYSPIASKPELAAQYGDKFAVQKMSNNNIQELTGYEGNVEELMNDVKIQLGLPAKTKVEFNDEFKESSVDKSHKIEEKKQDVPSLEVKQ